jgi:GNAT superfamily N-acetyltransferase
MDRGGARPRRAIEGEAAQIAELWLAARDAAAGVPATNRSDEEVRSWLADAVAGGAVWVTTDELNRPAAMMVLKGEWVEQLYVRPERQRRGHGSALIAFAQCTRPSLALWTFEANATARAFYEARGFERSGEPSSENEERAPALLYRWPRNDGGRPEAPSASLL